MRNILVHEYSVSIGDGLAAVELHLPPLEIRVRAILAEFEGQ